ncbi:angiopoietin-1 receptor-like [Porites lutea]|uniref:angiopoietin-1 receptor-like n=1 Tax=Porites lutea TaxID=51062 RepID=UPI003CC5106A
MDEQSKVEQAARKCLFFSSCIPAEPPVNSAMRDASCSFYPKIAGACTDIISNRYVYGDPGFLRGSESLNARFDGFLILTSEECKLFIKEAACRYLFPLCDTSLDKPRAQGVCRKTCQFVIYEKCAEELVGLRAIAEAGTEPDFDRNLINCTTYPAANGGEAPECYQSHALPGDKTRSTDCYHGIGVGYRGEVNITRSGRSCQRWISQCPHRHLRIPEDVVDGQNDSNMCRNPDASAPDGPWCYTTDPKVRWEYCNISRCPPRVPSDGPSFLRGYPLNSTAIHISWERIPPPLHNEKLLGYRIRYRRLGSQLYIEKNVTSNSTEVVISRLDYRTSYEIKVNGFNEVGHGPPGNLITVQTLQNGSIVVDINFELVINTGFHSDLLNRSSEKFIVMEKNITSKINIQFNESSSLKIYEVRVLNFSRGSVNAQMLALAIVNELTSKAEALTQFIEGFDTSLRDSLGVSALIVAEKPPPPGNLKVINVQTHYIVITWEKPKYGSDFQIQSYSVEHRKVGSKSFTKAAALSYSQTGMVMEDLEPATEYIIRLSSINKYGTSDGVLLTQNTREDAFIKNLILTIVLPLSLAFLFIVTVCLIFRPCCQTKTREDEKIVLGKRGNWIELPRSAVEFKEKLGEGAFGKVFKGEVTISGKFRNCAIKKLKENATEKEKRDLRNELEIMAAVGEHPNVINLIAACTETEPTLVVVRLAENGCLLSYLQRSRENLYVNVNKPKISFTSSERTRIARDIANGMLHLSNKKCVHRDLAARNVLFDENFVAMISDFGLSRDVYESGEYETLSGGMLPVRWMALESLEHYTYNTKTDVWSFGIVLWEIESRGLMPYSGLGGMEVVDFLKSGQRLKQPDGCRDKIFEIMTSCWHPEPSTRPSFSEIVTSLEEELTGLQDQHTENELP